MSKKALVVVLGELARSPRMQYHCMSLAQNDYDVTVIANNGGPSRDRSCETLESNNKIRQQLMNDPIDFKRFLPTKLALIIKPIWQALLLITQLIIAPIPHVIIVQNPPSIPTLPVLYMYTRLVRSRLIVDWHNYGYSILSLSQGEKSAYVRLMKFIEISFGRLADAGFCVSKAMQQDLKDNFRINYPLFVLYDKPPSHFKPLSIEEKHQFFMKMRSQIPEFESRKREAKEETIFTKASTTSPNDITYLPDRPAIILSSTSWTADEDFNLLLESLKLYDRCPDRQLPDLVCVITGKGPLKAFFQEEIKKQSFSRVNFVLPWLSAEDYASMIGSCDLGISLHSSSSGVDLPMKVVDLYGCAIPVLAYRYKAINELVVEELYGQTFESPQELFEKLTLLMRDFRQEANLIEHYRANIKQNFLKSRWEVNWDERAKPLFDRLSSRVSESVPINQRNKTE